MLASLAPTFAELRETTLLTVEALDTLPEGSPRFVWDGTDLALKLMSDMVWAPLPQARDCALDPAVLTLP